MQGKALQVLVGAAAVFFMASVPARALESRTPTNASVLPVILTAGEVPAMLGAGVGEISAFACAGEGLRPIPFQVDEINADGRVVSYFGNEDRVEPDATPGALDEDDEISFMLRDAGQECDVQSLARLRGIVAGVRLESDHLKSPARIYLLRSERGLKPLVNYVTYDAAKHEVASKDYTWRYAPDRPFMITDMVYPMLQGRGSTDIQDRLRVRIRASDPTGLVNLNFDEEDVDIHLKGVRNGPIRLVREMEGAINVLPGFSLPVSLTFINYDRLWIADVRFRVPAPAALFVGSLDMRIVNDFTDLRGTRISTKAKPEGVLVDGQMIAEEKTLQFGDEPLLNAIDDRQLGVALLGLVEEAVCLLKEAGVLQGDTHTGRQRTEKPDVGLGVAVLGIVLDGDSASHLIAGKDRHTQVRFRVLLCGAVPNSNHTQFFHLLARAQHKRLTGSDDDGNQP